MKKIIFTFVLVLVCLCSCNNSSKYNFVTEPVTIEYTQKFDKDYNDVYSYETCHVFKYNNDTIIEDHYFINPITNDTSFVCSDTLGNVKIVITDNHRIELYMDRNDGSKSGYYKVSEFTLAK